MIGWKCRVGYRERNLPDPTSLSDIAFTDNGIFSIGTVANEYVASSSKSEGQTYGYKGITVDNIQRLLEIFQGVLGEDYYVTYGVPVNDTNGGLVTDARLEQIRFLCPSFVVQYPNLLDILRTKRVIVYMHLPSLNRVIEFGEQYDTIRVFTVTETALVNKVNCSAQVPPSGLMICSPTQYGSGTGNPSCGTLILKGCDGTLESILSSPRYSLIGQPQDYNGRIWYQFYHSDTDTLIKSFIDAVFTPNNYNPPDFDVPDNPYEPGGPSGPTDPDIPPGTFDDESDPIPDSPLPTLSAANTGFTRIYNPTLSQVQALARYLWTDPDVIQTIWNHIKQFFEDPMEAIIGFNLVPVPVPDGGTENFALMYIDTGVQMTVAANQFVDLDCGTLELKRYYGSALDQSPYTKVSCYLPYIGTVNLNTDEVMGTTLQVKYRVDIVSGSCVAKIFVDGNCLYQYSGHCAITIPISSADFSSYVSAAISVGKLAAAAITAGAGAAMATGVAEASQQTNQVVTTTQVTNTARNPSTGRQITTGTTTTVQTRESPSDQSSTQASFSGLSPQNVANTVGAIMSSKPHIEHSGSFSGNSGYLGVRRPFIIVERPNMCMPGNYQALNGFPAMITMELSTCKGFTRVQQVQLTGMGRATNPEQAEILELLKSGVIL